MPTVVSLLTSLYPWGIVPEISAKGITHPAGQYLLKEKIIIKIQVKARMQLQLFQNIIK